MFSSLWRSGNLLLLGLRALARNKLRSFLTTLGLVIGVGCVIVVVAIGKGAARQVEEAFNFLGTNVLFVVPGATLRNGIRIAQQSTFTIEDVEAIRSECPSVAYASPQRAVNVHVVAKQLNWGTSLRGVNPEWFLVREWEMASGQLFTDADARIGAKVCVLGATVAQNLFPDGGAIGETIRIRNVPFKVLGIVRPKGGDRTGNDQDDIVLAPFKTVAQRMAGDLHPGSIMLSAVSPDRVDDAWNEIEALLRQRHRISPGDDPDFTIHSQVEMASASARQLKTMEMLLLSIGAISLIVGGIGIMNIMLVSVTERTREIGIRMAIGAKGRHVLAQFLFEAVTLAAAGGLIGVLVGVSASMAVAQFLQWPIVVSGQSILLAFGVAGFVGVFFGFYPARKASRLDPIEALRYE
ncbi:MAG: ABC transporter permease [Acidobacteriota bacterium]|nr:ABC transporter permease [Acidobacteriota bacterium]